ncbi:LysM peptidoglycan-binding domain-containing protein [Georgenia phoenicis]|uniref:LysM peptidoglycan-binding domain-containing protein n=1 Tax=unclassified Georgenia TaxID=2626815 RepID=UPI0039AEA250
MSALAIPAVPVREVPARRRGHLQLVGPGFVPAGAPARQEAVRPVPAARPAVRLTARGRLVRSLLVMVLALTAAVAGGSWVGGLVSDAQGYTGPVERVSVSAGDTLWGIAAATAAEGQDVREVVDDILELNGLASGDLAAGQQLVVPAG